MVGFIDLGEGHLAGPAALILGGRRARHERLALRVRQRIAFRLQDLVDRDRGLLDRAVRALHVVAVPQGLGMPCLIVRERFSVAVEVRGFADGGGLGKEARVVSEPADVLVIRVRFLALVLRLFRPVVRLLSQEGHKNPLRRQRPPPSH